MEHRIKSEMLVQMLLYINNLDWTRFDCTGAFDNIFDILIKFMLTELNKNDIYQEYTRLDTIEPYQVGTLKAVDTKILNKLGVLKCCNRKSIRVVGCDFNFIIKFALLKAFERTTLFESELRYWLNLYDEVENSSSIDRSSLEDMPAEYRDLGHIALMIIDLDALYRGLHGESESYKQVEWFIWQEFLACYIERNCDWKVSKQLIIKRDLFNSKPDIVMTKDNTGIIVDAKHYKKLNIEGSVYQVSYYMTELSRVIDDIEFGVIVCTSNKNKRSSTGITVNKMYIQYIDITRGFNNLFTYMEEFLAWMIDSV